MKIREHIFLKLACLFLFVVAAFASTGCASMNQFFGGGAGSSFAGGGNCAPGGS